MSSGRRKCDASRNVTTTTKLATIEYRKLVSRFNSKPMRLQKKLKSIIYDEGTFLEDFTVMCTIHRACFTVIAKVNVRW